jgi:MFS family permease
MFGLWIQNPVIPWLVYEITGSRESLGAVRFAGQLPMMLLVITAGVVADRHSRRDLVRFTQAAQMTAACVMGLLAARGFMSLYVLYAFVIINGVFRAFDVPSRQALIMDLAGPRRFANAIALRSAAFNVARLGGPALGGYLLEVYGPAACFFAKTALFVPVIFALSGLTGIVSGTLQPKTRGFKGIMEGLRYVRRSPEILRVLTLWSCFSLFGTSYIVLLPSFAKDLYGREAGGYGLIISMQGLGAVTAALVMAATSRRRSPQRWVIGGVSLVIVTLVALSLNKTYGLAFPLVALYGFGWVSFTVSGDTLIQRLVEDRFRGRVMGLRTFVFGGMFGIGALFTGFLAARPSLGLQRTVAIGAAALAAVLAVAGSGILRITLPAPTRGTPPARVDENG